MEVLPCGHVAAASRWQMCRHLLDAVPGGGDVYWLRLFRGPGIEGDLACQACASDSNRTLITCCEGCVATIADDASYFGGWRGAPEIPERPGLRAGAPEEILLPAELHGLVDLQPVSNSPDFEWVALTNGGVLYQLGPDNAVSVLAESPEAMATEEIDYIPWPGVNITEEQRQAQIERDVATRAARALRVSPDGRFAAIVACRGCHGVVLDLRRGDVTMRLDRGDYYRNRCANSFFSVAFAEVGGRTVLIHGTSWNRLDVSDPETGELLTPRGPIEKTADGTTPKHLLDYFHCSLVVSPGGVRVADNGWVWHPAGVVRTWRLDHWVTDNPWESEDGESASRFAGANGTGTSRSAGWTTSDWRSAGLEPATRTSSPGLLSSMPFQDATSLLSRVQPVTCSASMANCSPRDLTAWRRGTRRPANASAESMVSNRHDTIEEQAN